MFQFHYGSTGTCNYNTSISKCSFVSIPLWFDWDEILRKFFAISVSFNSTMVRLGPSADAYINGQYTFQFHYGSTGTLIWKWLRIGIVSFNSTMVRLGLFSVRLIKDA